MIINGTFIITLMVKTRFVKNVVGKWKTQTRNTVRTNTMNTFENKAFITVPLYIFRPLLWGSGF